MSIDYAASGTGTLVRAREARPNAARRRLKDEIILTHAYYLSTTRFERKVMMPYVPLGPLYVAAALKERGYLVRFFDTTFLSGVDDFIARMEELSPEIIGIYAIETTRGNAFEMMHWCRTRGITVIAGGPDPSSDPVLYLGKGADIVVAGEGEATMAEVMKALTHGKKLEDIPGVHTANGCAGGRKLIEDLDTLPFPARDLADFRPYFEAWRRSHGVTSLQMHVSRGCPHRCSWCGKPVFGTSYRIRSPENVVDEMFFLKMIYGPDQINFADDVFGVDPAWIARFHAGVLRKKARIPFECVSSAEFADRTTLRLMKEAGCFRIWYGAASGSPKVLSSMQVHFGVADIKRAAALTREAGIEVGFSLMLGHPAESVSDVELTRALIRETRPDRCAVNIAYPLKGTQFFREVEKDILPVWHLERYEEDNILTFRSRYSQNYYDLARALLRTEARVYAGSHAGIKEKIKCGMYRLGYGIVSNGLK